MLGSLVVAALFALAPAKHHPTMHVNHRPGCESGGCDRRVDREWYIRHRPYIRLVAMSAATASWFDDTGGTACGTHYTLGFAHLPGMACGTRVLFCAARCAVGTMEDHGPYVEGRLFDLNPGLKEAIGAGDLGTVRWRIAG